jgi:predicted metal-dependent peptidase
VAARTRLVLERPFLGALVLRLPLQAADPSWCPTARTDARTLFYNPAHVETLSLEQIQFTLCAQALHCALVHFSRRGHREQARWERACAHVVNLILVEEGLSPAPGAHLERDYAGMTAEEIYTLLKDADPPPRDSLPSHSSGPRPQDEALEPPPPGPVERRSLERQWKRRLAGVAQQTLQAGRLGDGMRRVLESVLQPTLPWRAVLARHMNGLARDDFSYERPSGRRGDPAIFPSLRSALLDVVVAVDVSGSIDAREFDGFVAEVDALKAQVRARMTLLTCDSRITGDSPWFFEPWERFALPSRVIGSGATDFRPVFEWVAGQDRRPDLVIYFTDAAGSFPDVEPDHPVLWLVKGPRPVPWGERIQLN